MIGIDIDAEVLRLGDFVSGNAYWSDLEGETIRVELRWETTGLATHATFKVVRQIEHEVDNAAEGRVPFRWKVPHEGPMSFEGAAVSVTWVVRAEVVRRLTQGDRAEAQLRVLPGVTPASAHEESR